MRSPTAAHQQDFLPLSAARAGREASGRREKEHGRRGGRGGLGEGAGRPRRGGGARRAGVLRGRGRSGGGARLSPAPSRALPAGGRDATATQRRSGPLRNPHLSALPSPSPRPRSSARPSCGACAEPSTSCSRWGWAGVGNPVRGCWCTSTRGKKDRYTSNPGIGLGSCLTC